VDIDAIIAKHGWALPAVLPDGPGRPAFTYTVGLFDPLPELLCVGPLYGVAGPTLKALVAELRRNPALARPGQRIALPAGDGVLPTVELGAVDACWHGLYVGRALDHHQRDDLEVLQVLAPDADGRFPGDPEVDPQVLAAQPVLADPERPWRIPHGLETLRLMAEGGDPVRHAVLLPIVDEGLATGREEVVPARPTPAGWELTAQPSLADWCTADDLVAATPVTDVPLGCEDLEVVRYAHVVRPSTRMVLRWGTCFHTDDEVAALQRILERPRFVDQVTVGFGAAPHALTFAVPPRLAEPLRIALRPLERDGRLVPRSLFHVQEPADLAIPHPDCPHCQTRW
jgi:hypothetical protein